MTDAFDTMTPAALRAWRTEQGLSQRAGAAALGLARSTLVAYEAGASATVPRTVALACAAISAKAQAVRP